MPLLKSLCAARNADGRLEVFRVDPQSDVQHIYQVAPNSGWNPWMPLPVERRTTSGIDVASNLDGRLEIFRSGWHIFQMAPNSGWSTWNRLKVGNGVSSAADGRLVTIGQGGVEGFAIFQQNTSSGWSAEVTRECTQMYERFGVFPTLHKAALVGWPNGDNQSLLMIHLENQADVLNQSLYTFGENIGAYYAQRFAGEVIEWIGVANKSVRRRWYRDTRFPLRPITHEDIVHPDSILWSHQFVRDGAGREILVTRKNTGPTGSRLALRIYASNGTLITVDNNFAIGMNIDEFALGVNQDGRAEVFVMSPDRTTVWHRWTTAPNSVTWSDWYVL